MSTASAIVEPAVETPEAQAPAEATHETNTYSIAGIDYSINFDANRKIHDQRSACLAIIAHAALADQLKDIKKAHKSIGLVKLLGILDDEQADAALSRSQEMYGQSAQQQDSIAALMRNSNAFSVPVSKGVTVTPGSFVQSASQNRAAAVAGARALLVTL